MMPWFSKWLVREGIWDAPWSWTPLQPDHLAEAFFFDDHEHGQFVFEVKRIHPAISVDFSTERRTTFSTTDSVEIHGAAYFFDLEKRKVSVLIVRARIGSSLDDPGGHLSLSSKNTHAGLEAHCAVYLSVPDVRSFRASLISMHDACNQPSSRFVRTRRHVRFVCTLTNAQDKGRASGAFADAAFKWPLRDVAVSVEDDGGDQWGAWDFVSRNDLGLLDDSDWVNRMCRIFRANQN